MDTQPPQQGQTREVGTLVAADLLELLRCPVQDCRRPLIEDLAARRLVCSGCRRRYPVDDRGLPTLIPEEAEPPRA